jgi:hypothetical protein
MTPAVNEVLRVLVVLAVAGAVYDRFVVDKIERLHPPLGVTAWEVVGGVLFTLVGLLFLTDLETFILALMCFAASGIPMILGSHGRN